ncbi:MAG: hypothetical protein R6V73_04640 [Anaerolineales bacterium]
MNILEAQSEMRSAFLGGFAGQLVSGLIWLIAVGSHYLPFITLYGMKLFGLLAALLVIAGAGLALYGPAIFSLGGWLAGVIFIVFAFIGRAVVLREENASG